MPQKYKVHNPNRQIRIERLVGNPSDPDNPNENDFETVGTIWVERRDFRGMQIGPDEEQIYRSQIRYTGRSTLKTREQQVNRRAAFGERTIGSEPFGSTGVSGFILSGIPVEEGNYVFDIGRSKRYKIEGITESDDDRFVTLYCERMAV